MDITIIKRYPFSFPVFFHAAVLGNAAVGKYQAAHMLICGFDPETATDQMREYGFSANVGTFYTHGQRGISKALTARFLSLSKDQVINHIRMIGLKRPAVSVKTILWLLKNDHIDMDLTELNGYIDLAEKESSEEYLADMLILAIKHRGRLPLPDEDCDVLVKLGQRIADGSLTYNTSEMNKKEDDHPHENSDTIQDSATPSRSMQGKSSAVLPASDENELAKVLDESAPELEKALKTIRAINDRTQQEIEKQEMLIAAERQRLEEQYAATRQTEMKIRELAGQQHSVKKAVEQEMARKEALAQRLRESELELQRLYMKNAESSEHAKESELALAQLTKELKTVSESSSADASIHVPDIHSSYTLHELFYDKDREAYRSNYIRLQEIRGGRVGYALTDQEVRASTDLFRRSKKNYLIDFSGTLAGLTDTILRHTEQKQCLQVVLICFVNSDRDISRMKKALTNVVKYALTDEGNLFLSWGCNDSIASGEYVARVIISIQEPSGEELYVSKVVRKLPIQHLSPAKDYEGRVPDFLLPYRIPSNPADDETGAR